MKLLKPYHKLFKYPGGAGGGGELHSTSWKYWNLHFVYILIADPSFNRNIFISLYLKFKTSAACQFQYLYHL